MITTNEILNLILSQKILPLFSHEDLAVNKAMIKASYDAGVRCFEFTNRRPSAFDNFMKLKQYCDKELPGMILGCGTIKNIFDAEDFTAAGADFLVSPVISEDLIDFSEYKNIPWIPGCATASEIAMAAEAEISLIKIFPANLLGGISFIKTMKEIFPEIKMMATGGIKADADEIKSWLENGADAVGLGSLLFKNDDTEIIKTTLADLFSKLQS